MNQPKVIVFDAYGTLLDIQTVIEEARHLLGEAANNVVNLWRAKQLEYSWLRTMMGTYADFDQVSRDALIYALAANGATIDDTNRQTLLDAWFRPNPFPDVPEALNRLRQSDHRLAILSNGSPPMLRLALEHSDLSDSFDHVLSVDAVRRFKPDPAVYQLVQDRIGIARDETLFVSSNGFDVAGARAFGFTVCWINRSRRPLDELGQRPNLEVASMTELAAILQ